MNNDFVIELMKQVCIEVYKMFSDVDVEICTR